MKVIPTKRKEQNTLQRKARAYDRLLTYPKQQQTAWGPGDPKSSAVQGPGRTYR